MSSAPTKNEVSAAVEDNERAIFDFTAAYSNGTLGLMDPTSAFALAQRASESVRVAANAFGVDAQEGDTPDALRGRLLDVYARAAADAAAAHDQAERETAERDQRLRTRAVMKSSLGLTDEDIRRMDFDRANGDLSPWLLATEQYVFG